MLFVGNMTFVPKRKEQISQQVSGLLCPWPNRHCQVAFASGALQSPTSFQSRLRDGR